MAADEALGPRPEPDRHRDRETDEDAEREHVLHQPEPPRPADHGDLEGRIDQLPGDLDDRGEQDEEAPEDQRVHQARHEPLEELALREDVRALPRDPGPEVAPCGGPGGPGGRGG